MFRPTVSILALAALAACGPAEPAPSRAPAAAAAPAKGLGYAVPPAVTAVSGEGGEVVLTGTAQPGARVRIGSPTGEARFATADADGRWRAILPAAAEPRIFGLSMEAGGRTVQSRGYLLLRPDGPAALLRAGGGTLRIGSGGPQGIAAFDFDRDGGAVVSGFAPPASSLTVRLDGRPAAEGRAAQDGRFALALAQPIRLGVHRLEVLGDDLEDVAEIAATPAAPLTSGPFRAAATPGGLRVDWMTPGGGVQSSLILD